MSEFELPGDCPSGEDCPVHFRLDRKIRNESANQYQAVTYVGEYCVLTGDNPKYFNPFEALLVVLSGQTPDDLFETSLYRVGIDGCLYDLTTDGKELKPERSVHSADIVAAEANHLITVSWAASLI